MNLVEIKTLVMVIESGSFSGAAQKLGYTQSAISQQMASLERSLELQLFSRGARRVRPTQAAIFLHARSLELISLLERVESDIERLSAGQVGKIRLGSFASAGADLLSRSLARFLRPRREVQVTVEDGEPFELTPKIIRGELDLALVFSYEDFPQEWAEEMKITSLMIDPVCVIAPPNHPFRDLEQLAPSNLTDETWIATHHSTSAYMALIKTMTSAGVEPRIIFQTNNFDAILGLVREAVGIAMIPQLALAEGTDVITLPVRGLPRRRIAAVTRKMEHNYLVQEFLASARQVANELILSPRSTGHLSY